MSPFRIQLWTLFDMFTTIDEAVNYEIVVRWEDLR